MNSMLNYTEVSGLRFYSLGVVAVNKKRGSNTIEVYPQEVAPAVSGEITDHVTKLQAQVGNVDGNDAANLEIDTTTTIKAEWIPLGNTNRLTSPDVRRGEKVILLKYADSEIVRWMEYDAMHVLRRRETLTWIVSNEANEDVPLTEDNTYFLTVSTHDKHITLKTTKSDGEPFAYTLELNTKQGFFCLTDDDGNYIFLNSKKRHIRAENKDRSFIELDKRIINIESRDEINLKTRKYTLNANESISEKTQTFKHDSETYTARSGHMKVKVRAYIRQSGSNQVTGPNRYSSFTNFGSSIVVRGVTVSAGGSRGPGNRK